MCFNLCIHTDNALPDTASLLDFARRVLCAPDPRARPASLRDGVLRVHPYFARTDYLEVHRFLAEMPIRSQEEKVSVMVVSYAVVVL